MAATIAGAFKAFIEAQGLGVPVFRDGVPVAMRDGQGRVLGSAYPFLVVQEHIGLTQSGHGDYGDPDADEGVVEAVQVDLYEHARRQTSPTSTAVTERYELPRQLARLFRGTGLQPYAPVHVYGTRVIGSQRWPVADNVLRHTWTVNVYRAES